MPPGPPPHGADGNSGPRVEGATVPVVVSGQAASGLQGTPEGDRSETGLPVTPDTQQMLPGAVPAQATLGGPRTGPGVGEQPREGFGAHMQETMCFLALCLAPTPPLRELLYKASLAVSSPAALCSLGKPRSEVPQGVSQAEALCSQRPNWGLGLLVCSSAHGPPPPPPPAQPVPPRRGARRRPPPLTNPCHAGAGPCVCSLISSYPILQKSLVQDSQPASRARFDPRSCCEHSPRPQYTPCPRGHTSNQPAALLVPATCSCPRAFALVPFT